MLLNISHVWLEITVIPALLIMSIFLGGRLATSSEINRRFLLLVMSTLLAACLEVMLKLFRNLYNVPLNINVFYCILNINAYCLMAYVAAYTRTNSQRLIDINFFILCISIILLLFFGQNNSIYLTVSPVFAVFFIGEAFVLQLIYQQYYGNGQFIVMNCIFIMLINSFLLQYLFGLDIALVYPVATIMLVFTFFYLEAPTYHKLIAAHAEIDNARLQAEASIKKANIANKAKSNFLASTSHEIRTPMNAILGINDFILEQADDDDTRNAALSIKSAGEYLLNLVNNILDISKIEAGKMDLYECDYHLWDLLKECEDDLTTRLKAKPNIKIIIKAQDELQEHLFGDVLRLKQIIINLLSNAAKFTDNGSISLNVSGVQKSKAELILQIIISDTGIGIHQDDLARIYEPFERSNVLESRHILGAGLGLTLVKNIINIMNGNIMVDSVYGKGTTFTVTVPQKISLDSMTFKDYQNFIARVDVPVIAHNSPDVWPEAHLLVVDDTPVNLVVAKGMLKSSEAAVDTAESGEQALQLIKANHYDIVFLDHKMPGMDGVQTLKLAKDLTADTKFVALTANSGGNAKQEYLSLGFDDYLPKPFKAVDMINILRKFLKQ